MKRAAGRQVMKVMQSKINRATDHCWRDHAGGEQTKWSPSPVCMCEKSISTQITLFSQTLHSARCRVGDTS